MYKKKRKEKALSKSERRKLCSRSAQHERCLSSMKLNGTMVMEKDEGDPRS